MQNDQDKDANHSQSSEMRPADDSLEGHVIHQESALVDFEEVFVGPLPHPEILAQYEEVLPGAAERIFTNAESQSAHRRKVEMTLVTTATSSVKHESNRAYLGLASGTIVAIILILCGAFLVYNGHDWGGTTLVVATIVGLVGIFVYSTQTRNVAMRKALHEAEYASELEEYD